MKLFFILNTCIRLGHIYERVSLRNTKMHFIFWWFLFSQLVIFKHFHLGLCFVLSNHMLTALYEYCWVLNFTNDYWMIIVLNFIEKIHCNNKWNYSIAVHLFNISVYYFSELSIYLLKILYAIQWKVKKKLFSNLFNDKWK